VIYLYRSKVSNDDFIPITKRLRTILLNRQKAVQSDYVFPGRHGGHKTIQNNRALEAAFERAGLTDVSSHNMRKTFATRLLSRGAAITDVQHLFGQPRLRMIAFQVFEGVLLIAATASSVQVYRVTRGLTEENFYLVDKYGGQGWNRTTDTGIFSPD